jgi:hypothetical protein
MHHQVQVQIQQSRARSESHDGVRRNTEVVPLYGEVWIAHEEIHMDRRVDSE